MRLSMVPSSRSRGVVSNGGPQLSVAYMQPYFKAMFMHVCDRPIFSRVFMGWGTSMDFDPIMGSGTPS